MKFNNFKGPWQYLESIQVHVVSVSNHSTLNIYCIQITSTGFDIAVKMYKPGIRTSTLPAPSPPT